MLRRVLLLSAVSSIAFGLTIPFLTLMARDRGVSLRAIGIMASSYLIAQMLLQMPFGTLSDRVGRAKLIAAGFMVEGIAAAGFVFADSAPEFIGLRVAQGVALALIMPAARAMIADTTPVHQRGQAFAWFIACFSGGLLLGPTIGGALAGPLGRNPLFLLSAAINIALGFWALGALRVVKERVERGEAAYRPTFREMMTRPVIGAFILGFAARILEGMFVGIWSIYLDDIGASEFEIGLSYAMWSIAFLVLAPWGGRLADRPNRWKRLLIANLAMSVMIVGYGLTEAIPIILLIGLLEGALSTVTIPTLDAYLSNVSDPRIQGRVQGTYATVGTFGAATFAFLGTVLYDVAHLMPFLVAGGALAGLTLFAVGFIREGETHLAHTAIAPEATTAVEAANAS
jgi:MFS family permease